MTESTPAPPAALRWGFVFLASPVPLTEEQKLDLARVAARAWFQDQGRVDFDWPACHGTLRATGEARALGSFVGQLFEAEVHVPEGSGVVRFLVAEAQLRTWGAEVAEA